ncbi:MAG: OmpH family outer membrane protein [Bacteroidota bacterium]
MKITVKIASLLIALFCIATTAQAQKFGFVSSAEILAAMPDVKQAEANLDALQKQLQKRGQGMVQKLEKDFAAVRQQIEAGDLSQKRQEEEAKKLKERELEIAKFEQDMVKQIQTKRNDLLKPIYEKVNNAISAVAKEEGYQFIFDEGVLLYFEDSQNVSGLVKAKLGI